MEALKPDLLCVDDEVDNLDALERLFRKKYNVLKASSAQKAFEILDQRPQVAVVVSDQRMPVITGVEFLEKSLVSHPDTSRILLTGYTDIDSVIGAINKGQIYRYVTKPWDPQDLSIVVDQAYDKYLLKTTLREKNQQLEAALQELQSLDRTKNQFMILINHELKTPLTAILSFAGLLQETILSDEQKLFTDRIMRSSEKLRNIVDDVLLIVKGEIGLLPVKRENLNLTQLEKSVSMDVLASVKAKNQNLVFSSTPLAFEADAGLTQIALNRALHNATKFGLPQSSIYITLENQPSDSYSLRIENSGPSISPAVIEKIMKPFQLDENIMNHSVGMGLGLSICHTILKCQKARLSIENTGGGVAVTFIFSR